MDGIINRLLYLSPTRKQLYVTDTSRGTPTHNLEHLACFLPGLLALGAHTLPRPRRRPESAGEGKAYAGGAGAGVHLLCDVRGPEDGLGPDGVRFDEGSTRWLEALGSGRRRAGRVVYPLDWARCCPSKTRRRDYQHSSSVYMLPPETVESFFVLWKTTEDVKWRERGWAVFEALEKHARVQNGYASVHDVDEIPAVPNDDMPRRVQIPDPKSILLYPTLKYLYLLFAEADIVPLDKDFARIGASAFAPQLHVNTPSAVVPQLSHAHHQARYHCGVRRRQDEPSWPGECAVLFSSDSVSHSHLSSPPLIYCDAISKSCSRRDYTRVTSWRTAAKTMPSTNEKGANLKISRTPKYAARPLAGIKGSGRNGFSPLPDRAFAFDDPGNQEKAAITRIQTSAPKPISTSRPLFRETWVHPPPHACWGEQDANAAVHCYTGPYYSQVQRVHFEDDHEVQARVVEVNSSSLTASTPSTSTHSTPSATTPPSLKLDVGAASTVKKKKRFRKKKTHGEYHFGATKDIVGIVMEIHGADDPPKLKNTTRTG
ncbi:glycoside hydrolase family protein [Salix suchowensis]|nr:glycoside hydrolase family protein [Salix suchowensis]